MSLRVARCCLLTGLLPLVGVVAEAAQSGSAAVKLDPAAIIRELKDYSVEGMSRRLGPDYDFYHPAGTGEKFPEVYLVPAKPVPADAQGGAGSKRQYQIGGPYTKESGDFSSTQAQVLYVPDHKLVVDPKTKMPNDGVGVDRVTIIEWSNNCFTEKPEPPWWGGGRPDPTSQLWVERVGNDLGVPVAVARGQGNWSNSGIVVFSSGVVAPAGTVTARGTDPTFKFPAHKLPTSVAITSKNEFALVTVVDTEKMIGQVAVFALAGGGKRAPFAHEWNEEYPGMPNVAVFCQMKLLGYVDLPGLNFPTGVCASSLGFYGRLNGRNGHAGMLSEFNLSNPVDRKIFNGGDNSGYTASTGFAVVISKYDGKAAFVDLQPLFEGVRAAYFTTEENFQKTRDMGEGPKQWPFTFEADPSWKPVVVKTLDVAQPTAVLTQMNEGGVAFVASLDGTITAFALGGLSTTAPADAAAIAPASTFKVGRNPVAMAYPKYTEDSFVVVCRGDREVSWVAWGKETKITRRLRDARLIDPVAVEVSDTHGIAGPICTVVDFKGRKIANYRYGVLTFATQGGATFGVGATGNDPFECGGTLDFPGHPFLLSGTNVN
ncbi:MAG: hypothetical protein ABIO94_13755 [Opitutaceae bacterium]